MKIVQLIEFLRKRLRTVVAICFVALGLLVILDAIPAIVDKSQEPKGPQQFPAFWAVFGFVACVLIVILSKWFGHAGIMTREDYYEQDSTAKASHHVPHE